MNTPRTPREEIWTAVFFYVTILVSGALVLMPGLRAYPAAKLAVMLMTLGKVIVLVRQELKTRALRLTIPQIYAQARAGRKFAPPALELAATVVWCWAVMVTC